MRNAKTDFVIFSAVTLLLIGIAEGGAFFLYRSTAPRMNYDRASLFEKSPVIFSDATKHGKAAYRVNHFPTIYYQHIDNGIDDLIYRRKPATTLRIFFYGGSSTAGSPFGPWGSFARFIADELRKLKKDTTELEIVNFGASGFGSTRVSHLVSLTIDQEPDLIVVYTGHNEIYDSDLHLDNPQNQVARFLLKRSNVVKLFYSSIMPSLGLRSKDAFTTITREDFPPFSPEQKAAIDAVFKRNIEYIASQASSRGVPVLFLSQVSNYFESPIRAQSAPFHKEAEEAALGATGKRDAFTEKQIAAWLEINPNDSLLNFYAGIYYASIERPSEAKQYLELALEHDDLPRRFKPSYARLLAQASAPKEGVYFLDLKKTMEASLGDGLIDGRIAIDTMHLTISGYRMIADHVLREFFFQNRFRSDLISYSEPYAGMSPLLDESDPRRAFYPVICERYIDSRMTPEQCAEQFHRLYANATRYDEKRRAIRGWEMLHYVGHLKERRDLILLSRKLNPRYSP